MTKQSQPVKENLSEISEQEFNEILAIRQATPSLEVSGPFINSAPKGNMFSEPFRQSAWIVGERTVLFTQENHREQTIKYYADRNWLNQVKDGAHS
jgi:hypothetical protein